jgi:hypothetical protein
MMRSVAPGLACLVLAGCLANDTQHRPGRHHNDAGTLTVDARRDDAGCPLLTFFRDKDMDGYGDSADTVLACDGYQPNNTTMTGDDCDDGDAARHPGATEVCDGVDTDCAPATGDGCPNDCTGVRDSGKVYLFCARNSDWITARNACAAAGFKLVEIDSAAENAFVLAKAKELALYGGNNASTPPAIAIGGSDRFKNGVDGAATEGNWFWDGGDQFWLGGVAGTAQNNHFQAWAAGAEPNNDNGNQSTANCAEMRADGAWYDSTCTDAQFFACRK